MSDTEYYESIRGYKRPTKPVHKGNWSLVLTIGGKIQSPMSDKPYALCVARKKALEKDPSCRGKLRIIPFNK